MLNHFRTSQRLVSLCTDDNKSIYVHDGGDEIPGANAKDALIRSARLIRRVIGYVKETDGLDLNANNNNNTQVMDAVMKDSCSSGSSCCVLCHLTELAGVVLELQDVAAADEVRLKSC